MTISITADKSIKPLVSTSNMLLFSTCISAARRVALSIVEIDENNAFISNGNHNSQDFRTNSNPLFFLWTGSEAPGVGGATLLKILNAQRNAAFSDRDAESNVGVRITTWKDAENHLAREGTEGALTYKWTTGTWSYLTAWALPMLLRRV